MKRILVISGDILPYPNFPTTGAGLRAWGIGKGLESRGHEVLLAMPRASVANRQDVPQNIVPLLYTNQELDGFIQGHKPDIVILQHWRLASYVKKPLEIPLVIDFHGPMLLEIQFQENPLLDQLKQEKIAALHKADFFTCAGEKQRYYFESWLLMAGFDLRQEVIRTIPVSLDPELPAHTPQGEPSFVYGGMFLPWQDPVLGLTTLVECLEKKQQGFLKFFGGKHPVVAFSTAGFEKLKGQLEQSPHVQIQPMIPRAQLIQEYCRSHAAIDVMQRNAERELAFTTRTVEYLWCGLPVIYNDYAELAEYIRSYNAGWTVDPKDKEAIIAAIEDALNHPDTVAERGRNAQQLVRERLTWDKSIEPLDAFCRHPIKREKGEALVSSNQQSARSQLKYFKDKILFHLKNEGFQEVLKRGWRKYGF